jgi:hypothetical protein
MSRGRGERQTRIRLIRRRFVACPRVSVHSHQPRLQTRRVPSAVPAHALDAHRLSTGLAVLRSPETRAAKRERFAATLALQLEPLHASAARTRRFLDLTPLSSDALGRLLARVPTPSAGDRGHRGSSRRPSSYARAQASPARAPTRTFSAAAAFHATTPGPSRGSVSGRAQPPRFTATWIPTWPQMDLRYVAAKGRVEVVERGLAANEV